MGLLTFLKKPNDRPATLPGQAYHSTTPSLPPLKGVYPVAGNGPNVYDSLNRSHQRMSEIQLAGGVVGGGAGGTVERSVASPFISRFLDLDSDRPSTAPNLDGSIGLQMPGPRQKRESFRGSPIAMRKPRGPSTPSAPLTPVQLSPAPPDSGISFQNHPGVKPPTVSPHARHVSMQNMPMPKGFVDLLDAQSEIKPADFKSRLKAAGARDYGEDVADRNIGENGHNLTSDKVKAFYAVSLAPPLHLQRLPTPTHVAKALWRDDTALPRPKKSAASADAQRSRTRSLSSTSFNPHPMKNTAFLPRDAGAAPREKKKPNLHDGYHSDYPSSKRRAAHTYTPAGPPAPSAGKTENRPKSFQRLYIPDNRQLQRPATSYHRPANSMNELGIYAPSIPKPSSPRPPVPPKSPRDLALANRIRPATSAQTRSFMDNVHHNDRPASARQHARGGSAASSALLPPPSLAALAKRHSLSSITTDYPRLPRSSNDWVRSSVHIGRIDIEPSLDGGLTSPAPSPHVLRNDRARSDGESSNPYERTRSLVSMRGKSRLDEIYEYIPMRTSSLRNWSMTSATPTTSSSGSNPFPRPQSRHTANTSIDIPVLTSLMTSSHSSLASGGGHASSHCAALESRLQTPPTSAATCGNAFNIDDYLSSEDDVDADSFVIRRNRNVGEEGLLFRDMGYGAGGAQLPGLFESIPEVDTASPPKHTSQFPKHSYRSPSRGSKRHSLDSKTHAPGYADTDEEEALTEDEPRADLCPGRRGAKRLSALGERYGAIEEEKHEKVDVRTAIRLRKEAKAKKRAVVGHSARRVKGKKRVVEDDEDNHADVE